MNGSLTITINKIVSDVTMKDYIDIDNVRWELHNVYMYCTWCFGKYTIKY